MDKNEKTDFLFETKPYSLLQPSLMFRDTASSVQQKRAWKNISFDYIATGEEVFITIGSFKKQEHNFELPPEYKGNYYLYLDAVSMVPEDRHELVCKDVDSLRSLNYQENERHSLLEKKVALYRKNVPAELPPQPTILQRIDTLVIPDILFATASARLNEGSFRVLDSFCSAIAIRKIDSLVIGGHTDSVGTLVYNNRLSEDRAGSVSSYLKSRLSFDDNLFRTYYFAYLHPLASNITPAGRQRNRRVEIYLYTHE
jgi:outer membrane protein OmpA-like peptidoglycan-associated protein